MTARHSTNGTLFRWFYGALLTAGLVPILLFVVFAVLGGHPLPVAWIVGAALGALAVVAGVGLVVARQLTRAVAEPLARLAEGATEIARGNFSHRIEVDSRGEVGRLAKLFNYMTTELRRLNEMNLSQIIAERTKTSTIIRNIADGVIVTDPQDRVLVFNSAAERWFGVKEEDLLQQPIGQFIKNRKLLNLLRKVGDGHQDEGPPVEITVKPPGEWRERTLAAKAARVFQQDRTLIGTVTILRDISREKEIDRMKTELVSMVAHELRSPLTSISGFSELLLDRSTTKAQAMEYASIILKESNRLGELINKFLDISRIESGKVQPKKVPLNLGDAARTAVVTNAPVAQRKGIVLRATVADRLPEIQADPGMVDQVLLNLLSNAIKYSPPNTEVEVRVTATPRGVQLTVVDHGYGIPEKALPHIFDKFYRVTDDERVREVTGSGLGLSLVKQIVDVHGGTIAVSSKVGEGTTFVVTFPVTGATQASAVEQKE
ncbi:MAG: cell wall metabolism sensor histidine kinase WalK [candidate division KSB1 bacterium]|nr:cell wall metabolism sensor histidine kinase WalK [candidate division KSB1 bacterium]MDZ7295608.1 cell wall metabolism sensor histidine kinase WalK [candidate division KSB1 bacterium]MDZ7339685.1 cell wall metabolism sensor histidine kinase WalK [candidate division KSB1 bacterium]MDZ7377957.1 cell wall metabolism sensor histidine kinase WalK [candidate division KSB1 bacterium]MDZ7386874.1 cell wall metabolism sensor histidine kinase WalK [candidate division KSB1 bacterium]